MSLKHRRRLGLPVAHPTTQFKQINPRRDRTKTERARELIELGDRSRLTRGVERPTAGLQQEVFSTATTSMDVVPERLQPPQLQQQQQQEQIGRNIRPNRNVRRFKPYNSKPKNSIKQDLTRGGFDTPTGISINMPSLSHRQPEENLPLPTPTTSFTVDSAIPVGGGEGRDNYDHTQNPASVDRAPTLKNVKESVITPTPAKSSTSSAPNTLNGPIERQHVIEDVGLHNTVIQHSLSQGRRVVTRPSDAQLRSNDGTGKGEVEKLRIERMLAKRELTGIQLENAHPDNTPSTLANAIHELSSTQWMDHSGRVQEGTKLSEGNILSTNLEELPPEVIESSTGTQGVNFSTGGAILGSNLEELPQEARLPPSLKKKTTTEPLSSKLKTTRRQLKHTEEGVEVIPPSAPAGQLPPTLPLLPEERGTTSFTLPKLKHVTPEQQNIRQPDRVTLGRVTGTNVEGALGRTIPTPPQPTRLQPSPIRLRTTQTLRNVPRPRERSGDKLGRVLGTNVEGALGPIAEPPKVPVPTTEPTLRESVVSTKKRLQPTETRAPQTNFPPIQQQLPPPKLPSLPTPSQTPPIRLKTISDLNIGQTSKFTLRQVPDSDINIRQPSLDPVGRVIGQNVEGALGPIAPPPSLPGQQQTQ